jgi:hypothetical protein
MKPQSLERHCGGAGASTEGNRVEFGALRAPLIERHRALVGGLQAAIVAEENKPEVAPAAGALNDAVVRFLGEFSVEAGPGFAGEDSPGGVALSTLLSRLGSCRTVAALFEETPRREILMAWPDVTERAKLLELHDSDSPDWYNAVLRCSARFERMHTNDLWTMIGAIRRNHLVPLREHTEALVRQTEGSARERAFEVLTCFKAAQQHLPQRLANGFSLNEVIDGLNQALDATMSGCLIVSLSVFPNAAPVVAPLKDQIEAARRAFARHWLEVLDSAGPEVGSRLPSDPRESALLRLTFLLTQSDEIDADVCGLVDTLEEATAGELAATAAELVSRQLVLAADVARALTLVSPRREVAPFTSTALGAARREQLAQYVPAQVIADVPLEKLGEPDFAAVLAVLAANTVPRSVMSELVSLDPNLLCRADRLQLRVSRLESAYADWRLNHPAADPTKIGLTDLRHESVAASPSIEIADPLSAEIAVVCNALRGQGWNPELTVFLVCEGFLSGGVVYSGAAYIRRIYLRHNIRSFVPSNVLDRELDETIDRMIRCGALLEHKGGQGLTLSPHSDDVTDRALGQLLKVFFRESALGSFKLRGNGAVLQELRRHAWCPSDEC